MLESFGEKGQTVLDSFSGSGTVLFEAAKKDMNSHGFEINPAAYVMTKFYTSCNKTIEERRDILKSYAYIKKTMLSFPFSDKEIQSHLDDSRNTYKYLEDEVDLIITFKQKIYPLLCSLCKVTVVFIMML